MKFISRTFAKEELFKMKKVLILTSLALIISLSACKKKGDIVCNKRVLTLTYKVTVSEDEYKECFIGSCNTYSLGSYTQAEKVEDLRYEGYKCK